MDTAYVVQAGAVLRRDGEVLQVFVARKKVADLPTPGLRRLVLVGNVMITPGAFDLLVDRNIDTVFLSHHGRFRARITGRGPEHVMLRLAQMEHLRDPARALEIGKRIVQGKVRNQRAYLMHCARRRSGAAPLRAAAAAMNASVLRLAECSDLDAVRGCEGAASAAYFKVFGKLIEADGFSFDGRNRRPPLDPVNAMLSLGYTLLTNAEESAVHVVGLDPWLGALHSPLAGRPSLVCDLVEEFRAPVVDALVVAAINKNVVRPDMFEDAGPGEPVVFKRDGMMQFLRMFEKRLDNRVTYEPVGTSMTMRAVIEQQARRYARHILGKENYECYSPR